MSTPPTLKDDWETPVWLFDLLDAEFHFRTDLAANERNRKCELYLGLLGTDALDTGRPWHMSSQPCFLNAPYSNIGKWAAKASCAAVLGATIVMLAPATRTGRPWFHDHVIGWASEIRYVRGRVRFVPPPDVVPSSPSFDSMVIIYRPDRIGETTVGRSIDATGKS